MILLSSMDWMITVKQRDVRARVNSQRDIHDSDAIQLETHRYNNAKTAPTRSPLRCHLKDPAKSPPSVLDLRFDFHSPRFLPRFSTQPPLLDAQRAAATGHAPEEMCRLGRVAHEPETGGIVGRCG